MTTEQGGDRCWERWRLTTSSRSVTMPEQGKRKDVSAGGGASWSFSAAGDWVALPGQVQQRHLVDLHAPVF